MAAILRICNGGSILARPMRYGEPRLDRPPPFARVEPALRKSITFDNDTAFAQHALLRTMRAMTTWFCDAYDSWQKGGVENANGRLRRWLPRQTDIDKVSDEEIQDIVITAKLTPRKCLGFKTPFQAILKELGKDVQIQFA
jgi:IS30 family transposase